MLNLLISFLSLTVFFIGTSPAFADGVKANGAVQAGYSWSSAVNESGFSLKQSYFKLTGEGSSNTGFVVDVPFTSTGATSTAFTFADAYGQAYVFQAPPTGFQWRVGQFDSDFSLEPNDLPDGFFATHGVIYAALPSTHVGFLAGYEFGKWSVTLLVANTRETSAPQSGLLNDYGISVSYRFEKVSVVAGILTNASPGASSITLYEGRVGVDLNGWRIDFEALAKSVAGSYSSLGFLLQPVVTLSEKWDLGVRAEYLSVTPVGSSITAIRGSMGPRWKAAPNVLVKMHYTPTSLNPGYSIRHEVALDAVFKI